jgi:hypothetical protein
MDMTGKRVLFIAPVFFGYERIIVETLEGMGATVDYFSDRPGTDFFTKALIRVNRRLLAAKTNRYYDSIIESARGKIYDHILIIRGEAISVQRLRRLRREHPNARASLYLWDSMHYNPNAQSLVPEFDQCYSFDRVDVEEHAQIEFLPLFYGGGFDRSANDNSPAMYDACFIGTIHTDRYKVLERVIESLEAQGRRLFVYCYYPSRTLFRLRSMIDPGFRLFGKKYVDFSGMQLTDVIDKIAASQAIIDVNRPNQRGLTMRSIEAVGAQRKLITTNEDIVNYDIYSPQGVSVIDRVSPDISGDFLDSEDVPFSDAVRDRYSMARWLSKVLGLDVYSHATSSTRE